jgi:hypothetical protein
MSFHPSVHSFGGYGNEAAEGAAEPAADKAEKKRKRIARRRKKALKKAKRQAIIIPVAVGGSLLLLGLLGFGARAMLQKKASKKKAAQ